jgi:hypothetical protein
MKPTYPSSETLFLHTCLQKQLETGSRSMNLTRRANEMLLNSSQQGRRNKFVQFFGTLLHQKLLEEVSVAEWSILDLQRMPRFHEPLQYDHHKERMREDRRHPSLLASSSSILEDDECPTEEPETWKTRVTFDETVVIVPVPLKSDYSEQLRTKLWSNSVKLCKNIGKRVCTHSDLNMFVPCCTPLNSIGT